MQRALAAAAVVVLAAAVATAADDPPGLALAKRVVEEQRGDEHRAKMRIVWPENVETEPPEGAEVTLIDGYICNGITRITWHKGAGKLDVGQLFAARTWFYNKDGESFGARTTTIDAAKFAEAWCAARYVLGARDERLEPEPADHPLSASGTGAGSHESEHWVRLREAADAPPLHVGNRRGWWSNWEGVREWSDIRDHSVFELVRPFLPPRDTPASVPSPEEVRGVVAEIVRAPSRLDLGGRSEQSLLLEVCLRLAGEFGDASALKAVDALGTAVRSAKDADEHAARHVLDETEIATTKLRLRTAWDPAEAGRALRANTHEHNSQEDLDKWVRARFREKDPDGYRAFLSGAGIAPDQEPMALEANLAELNSLEPEAAAAAARKLLADPSAPARIVAARAVLAADPTDGDAQAALVAIAFDRKRVDAPTRCWALGTAAHLGALSGPYIRKMLDDPAPEDARVVEALIVLAADRHTPASEQQVLAAWRRVCDGPVDLGVATALEKLVELRDKDSWARVSSALDRLAAALARKAPGTEGLTEERLAGMRVRAEKAIGLTPPK